MSSDSESPTTLTGPRVVKENNMLQLYKGKLLGFFSRWVGATLLVKIKFCVAITNYFIYTLSGKHVQLLKISMFLTTSW